MATDPRDHIDGTPAPRPTGEAMDEAVRRERARLMDEAARTPSIGAFLWPAVVVLMSIAIGVVFTLTFQKVTDARDAEPTTGVCTVEAAATLAGEGR